MLQALISIPGDFPLLKWVQENGTTKCPVLTVRRFKQERAA